MFEIPSVPSDPVREMPATVVSEIGEIEIVSAAGGRVDGELILKNEGSAFDYSVDGD